MKRFAILLTFALLCVGFVSSSNVSAQGQNQQQDKVWICHRTNSVTNPYRKIHVAVRAVDGEGGNGDHYKNHTGPVATSEAVAQGLKDNKQNWGDIIPPIPGVHSGLNWTEQGQAIFENRCKFVPAEPVYSCDSVTVTGLGDGEYKFDVATTAENGAVFQKLYFEFGDGATEFTTESSTTHKYEAPGDYNVIVHAKFQLNGKENVASLCYTTVSFQIGDSEEPTDEPEETVTEDVTKPEAKEAEVVALPTTSGDMATTAVAVTSIVAAALSGLGYAAKLAYTKFF